MSEKRFYLLIASRTGKLSVTVSDGYDAHEGDVIMGRYHTIDEAFDWKELTEASVAKVLARHCATCE